MGQKMYREVKGGNIQTLRDIVLSHGIDMPSLSRSASIYRHRRLKLWKLVAQRSFQDGVYRVSLDETHREMIQRNKMMACNALCRVCEW